MSHGAMKRVCDEVYRWVRQREIGDGNLIDIQDVEQKLLQMISMTNIVKHMNDTMVADDIDITNQNI